jgi:hypothetical protein
LVIRRRGDEPTPLPAALSSFTLECSRLSTPDVVPYKALVAAGQELAGKMPAPPVGRCVS